MHNYIHKKTVRRLNNKIGKTRIRVCHANWNTKPFTNKNRLCCWDRFELPEESLKLSDGDTVFLNFCSGIGG